MEIIDKAEEIGKVAGYEKNEKQRLLRDVGMVCGYEYKKILDMMVEVTVRVNNLFS